MNTLRHTPARATLGLALSALVVGCGAIVAQTGTIEAQAPLTCAVVIDETSSGILIEGMLQSDEAVSGIYRLRVTRGGNVVNQGGSFSLRAGETETLGRVVMNGSTTGLDTDMTVEIDGRVFTCPTAI